MFFLSENGPRSQHDAGSVVVKQEVVDDINCTNGYNYDKPRRSSAGGSTPSEDKEVKSPKDNALYEFPGRSSPQKMKREYLNHVSRSESTPRAENSSRTEGAPRPEEVSSSPPSLRGPESRLFQPDERIRNLHFEALKKRQRSSSPVNDWPYPTKQVFKGFQPALILVERSVDPAVSTQRFPTRGNDNLSPREQQQSFQRETRETSHVKSLNGNEGITQLVNGERNTAKSNAFHEKPMSGINGSPSDRPVKNVSSSILPENNASNSNVYQKDEEPVWKTYQWYRDRKRPLSQQTKRQKTEQTIFMQYNEIRCKRVEEGRMVNERRRASEPCLDPIYSREMNHSSPSSPTKARSVESSNGEGHFASQSQQAPSRFLADHRVLPHTSSTPRREIRHLKNSLREYTCQRRNSEESYFNGKADFQYMCGRESGTFAKEKTAQHVVFCHDKIKPRNQERSANAEEKAGVKISANEDAVAGEQDDGALEGIRSPTEQADNIEVLPDKRRYPQDVAKILRLNRIVKAVRNNKEKQLPYSTTERQRTIMTSKRNPSHTTSIENEAFSDEMQIENPSDSDREINQRCGNGHVADETMEDDDDDDDDGEEEKGEKRNSTRNLIDCFFLPERERQQIRNGRVDTLAFPQSVPEREEFSAKHLNGLGAMQARDDNDTVCQVNGLLSLPGFKETKFNISLGELKRRMNPPETLTRVEMISYVRQAKSSGRVLLDKNNIITANRSRPTILSRLCESEAQLLADGILKMNREYLPLTTLARKTVETYKDDDCKDKHCEDCRLKLRRRIVDVEITR